jgi:hypothetical protein
MKKKQSQRNKESLFFESARISENIGSIQSANPFDLAHSKIILEV